MKRSIALAVAALLTAFGLSAATATASMIPIYANPLDSAGTRAQVHKSAGENCERRGTRIALRVELGDDTRGCAMSPPVVGRDLALVVTGRLLGGTPERLRRAAFISAGVRSGQGSSIQALVFPEQRKLQVIKNLPDGSSRYLAIEKNQGSIRGLNKGNRIFLAAINRGEPGHCRIVVRVNGRSLAKVGDTRCGEIQGRNVEFGLGAARGGTGAVGSFSGLQVSLPNPF